MSAPAELPPHVAVWALAQAIVPSRALHLVAELGVADVLGEEPLPAEDLAGRCQADPDALARILRLLIAHGIFRYEDGRVAHNAASGLLRRDHPMSMNAFARLNSLPVVWESLGALPEAVRTGVSGAEIAHPGGFFGALAERPAEAAVFADAMAAKAHADIAEVLAHYDFGGFSTIADIGGGQGHLLRAVLATAPGAKGILFDLPDVIAAVDPLPERVQAQPGDFFADPLPAADAYLLMEVLHDWRDSEVVAILRAVGAAAAPGARVLVLEHVAPDEGFDLQSVTLDVLMLAVTGGRERSAAELNRLFADAGLAPHAVHRTGGAITVVEATVP
jgi:hypothetical protein